MVELVGSIHKDVEDVVVIDTKDLGDFGDKVKEGLPKTLGDREFQRICDAVPEEASYGFIVGKTPGHGKDVVLYGRYRGAGDLGCEVPDVVLAETEELLAVLEHDLDTPPHGVSPVGSHEVEGFVRSEQSVPRVVLHPLDEEKADIDTVVDNVCRHVVAAQAPAVFLPLLAGQLGDDSRCGEGLPFKEVFGDALLADLYHAEVVAPDVAGLHEMYHLAAGEPAVGEYVVKAYTSLYCPAYHFHHECDFALGVLFLPHFRGASLFPVLGEAAFQLIICETMLLGLAFLPDNGHVENQLRLTVGQSEEQRLESENHAEFDMGEHLPYFLGMYAAFGKVRVVDHQAHGRSVPVVSPHPDYVHQAACDLGMCPAPVRGVLLEKPVEHILAAVDKAA